MLYAYSERRCRKITVILAQAYGGGLHRDEFAPPRRRFHFAWPSAEIAVMGPEGAATSFSKKEIERPKTPSRCAKEVAEYKRSSPSNVAALQGLHRRRHRARNCGICWSTRSS